MLALAGIGFPATLMSSPIFTILPSFYVLHAGADMATIGFVLLLARVIDAFFDPVLGLLSDRTRSRFGPRLPWIGGGVALAIPSVWLLYVPPAEATALYFFLTSSAVLMAWTMIAIPHNAWVAELSTGYDERTRIFGIKNVVATLGSFAFFLLPPMLAPFTGTTEINGTTMKAVALVIFVLLPLSLVPLWFMVPRQTAQILPSYQTPNLRDALQSVTRNPLLLIFITVTILVGTATGMSSGLAYLYMEQMELGEWLFLTSIGSAIAGIASVPLWSKLTARFGKPTPWALSIILSSLLGLFLLVLQPGMGALIPLMVIFITTGVLHGVNIAIPSSLLADIADYERLRSGNNTSGNYFSLLILLSKFNAAIGASAGFWVASSLGYDPEQSGIQMGLLTALVLIPATLNITAGLLLLRYPIGRQRQGIITSRLASLDARYKAAAED